jgi:hypothetical protein
MELYPGGFFRLQINFDNSYIIDPLPHIVNLCTARFNNKIVL